MSGHFSAQDEDDDDERQQETWFAGGERSGISVQNPNAGRGPNNLVQGLLRRAAQEGAGGAAQSQRQTAFGGGGHVLGGEGTDSQYLGGEPEDDGPAVTRWITFWREGFTVDSREGAADGEYRRYDDPANAAILRAIDSGLAPPEILNVEVNQRVDVQVSQRTNEDYVPPPVKPFSGAGNRLGAPTPGASTSSAPAPAPSSSATSASINTRFEVDQTQPMTSVQIRLADGTRMVCRMNLSHTVGDLRSFINASRPENLTRPYTIGTTFPNRVLEDDSLTVEDAKVGGSVVVQRWV